MNTDTQSEILPLGNSHVSLERYYGIIGFGLLILATLVSYGSWNAGILTSIALWKALYFFVGSCVHAVILFCIAKAFKIENNFLGKSFLFVGAFGLAGAVIQLLGLIQPLLILTLILSIALLVAYFVIPIRFYGTSIGRGILLIVLAGIVTGAALSLILFIAIWTGLLQHY